MPNETDAADVVILSVRLKSGRFESSLQVPLIPGDDTEKEQHLKAWADLVQTGFRIGASAMSVSLNKKVRTHG